MYSRLWIVLYIISALGFAAHASDVQSLQPDSVVETTRDLRFIPVAFEEITGHEKNLERRVIELDAGTPLFVREIRTDEKGAEFIRLQYDPDIHSENDFWLIETQIQPDDFFVAVPNLSKELAGNDPGEEVDQIDEMFKTFQNGKLESPYPNVYCMLHPLVGFCSLTVVKYEIEKSRLSNHRLKGVTSPQLMSQLSQEGWAEVGCARRNHPTFGMVCSYDDTFKGLGYVEMWTGRGWYSGKRYNHAPWNGTCTTCRIKR